MTRRKVRSPSREPFTRTFGLAFWQPRQSAKKVWIFILIAIFFFQAEDGRRDAKVTGVQTCALPICVPSPPLLWPQPIQSLRDAMGIFRSCWPEAPHLLRRRLWGMVRFPRYRRDLWSLRPLDA